MQYIFYSVGMVILPLSILFHSKGLIYTECVYTVLFFLCCSAFLGWGITVLMTGDGSGLDIALGFLATPFFAFYAYMLPRGFLITTGIPFFFRSWYPLAVGGMVVLGPVFRCCYLYMVLSRNSVKDGIAKGAEEHPGETKEYRLSPEFHATHPALVVARPILNSSTAKKNRLLFACTLLTFLAPFLIWWWFPARPVAVAFYPADNLGYFCSKLYSIISLHYAVQNCNVPQQLSFKEAIREIKDTPEFQELLQYSEVRKLWREDSFIDPWGYPFYLKFNDNGFVSVRSNGPNGKDI